MVQIEGVSATQIYQSFKSLENQIETLRTQTPPAPGYLSREATAQLLGVSLPTVADWQKRGLIQGYRLGRRVFFKPAEIELSMVAIPARRAATK